MKLIVSRLIITILLLICISIFPVYSQDKPGVIPKNITGFYFEMVQGNGQTGMTEKYLIKQEKDHYQIFIYNRDRTRNLEPEFRYSRKLENKEFLQLISIMNHINFLGLPQLVRNNAVYRTSNPSSVFRIKYENKGRNYEKKITCMDLELKYSSQDEMFKMSFLKYYILDIAYGHSNSLNKYKK